MSYQGARNNFEENTQLLDTATDPEEWNLNHGLLNLTNAIEQDMAQIQQTLRAILDALQRG